MSTITKQPATRPTKKAQTPLVVANELLTRYARLTDDVQAHQEALKPITAEMADIKAKLQEWAEKNPEEFEGKKTLQLEDGSFGFRAGLKSVAFPEDAPDDIQTRYLEAVRKELPGAIEEKVDSKKIVSVWAALPNLRKRLEKLGLSLKQPDQFIISLKK